MDSVERAKAFLKQTQSSASLNKNNTPTNTSQPSLYDHLTQLLMVIAKEKPENALNSFESLSVKLKESYLQQHTLKEVSPSSASLNTVEQQKVQSMLDRNVSLFTGKSMKRLLAESQKQQQQQQESADSSAAVPEDEDATAEEEKEYAEMPDWLEQARLLEWAGVGFDSDESYRLLLAMRELAGDENIEKLRFFGKFLGTKRDYYVCETKLKSYPDPADDNPMNKTEAPGSGVNEHVYYVCNYLGEPWFKLPDVTPQQIKFARNMRRLLTGDINAVVTGYPRFDWSEASYLRAQIARIAHATVLAPAGAYQLDESDEPAIIDAEEYSGVTSDDEKWLSASGWVHHRPLLLKQGRVKLWQKPESDEQDDENKAAEPENPEDTEESLPLLSSLESENEEQARWIFRTTPSLKGLKQSAIFYARSLQWPGAVSVAQRKVHVNIYIGNGLKQLNQSWTPPALPAVQAEWKPAVAKKEDDADADADADDAENNEVVKLEEQTDPTEDPVAKAAEEERLRLEAEAAAAGDNGDGDDNQDDD